ncbi:tumor necrosis factor receptor superfamily member 6 [Biomphalaria pfeifferi]|uniref:Tumor necrosis factor receptor superfamily member 6 n=1 Tax=Biomphalaria pfeifferi TaxID=112525 RepID=A0AAD8B0G1_BIOPF|nr:tumor necrosis factor receptor superfamily member 6 [Biomphalaria pfeifferi]
MRTNLPFTSLLCAILSIALGCTLKDSPFGCLSGPCEAGEYFNTTTKFCQPCPEGTYQAADRHNCTYCRHCSKANVHNNEVVQSNCTRTTDAKIGCRKKYWRTVENQNPLHSEYSCWQCTKCKKGEKLLKRCTESENTECAPLETKSTAPKQSDESSTANSSARYMWYILLFISAIVCLAYFLRANERFT